MDKFFSRTSEPKKNISLALRLGLQSVQRYYEGNFWIIRQQHYWQDADFKHVLNGSKSKHGRNMLLKVA